MAKKSFMVLVLAALVAGGAFAQSGGFKPSIGVGGYFTSDFGGGVEGSAGDFKVTIKTPYIDGGGFVFFDATYADISVGFFGGGGKTKTEATGQPTEEADASYMGLDIGLLAKLPVTLSSKLAVFPLLGITYRVMLSVKDEDGNKVDDADANSKYADSKSGDFSALWFKLGGGLDFSFTNKVFLRGSVLYGIRLANKFEKDSIDTIEKTPGWDAKTLLGHGLEVKLAIGCRL